MATAITQRFRQRLANENSRRVLDLALPAVGEQLLNMAIGLADTYMVGHLGAEAVAAVGLSNQSVMLVTTFFAATATGVTALVARHTGAREPEEANGILQQGYLIGALLGAILSVLGVALAEPTMVLLRSPAEVVPLGAAYLRIVSLTFVLACWMFVGNAALRGAGDTRSPLTIMLVVNVVNIGVAYLAIYGPGPLPSLGVAGSAVGAATARGVGGLLVTWMLWRGRASLRLQFRRMLPNRQRINRILNIGLPAGGEHFLMRLAQMIFVMTVASLGTKALAAHQLVLQAESLSFMPGFGFAVAATTLTGQNLGAGKPARAKAEAYLAQRMGAGLMTVMGVLFFFFAAPLLRLFIDDPAVINLGVWPLRMVAFSQPLLGTMMVLSGALRGAGDTRMTMVITTIGLWLVRLPVAFLLVGPLGLIGAWVAMIMDTAARALGMWLRFRSGRWSRLRP